MSASQALNYDETRLQPGGKEEKRVTHGLGDVVNHDSGRSVPVIHGSERVEPFCVGAGFGVSDEVVGRGQCIAVMQCHAKIAA